MTDPNTLTQAEVSFDEEANSAAALREKLADAMTPGYRVEFDPEEADKAGAFVEDALSEQDAAESDIDQNDLAVSAIEKLANANRL